MKKPNQVLAGSLISAIAIFSGGLYADPMRLQSAAQHKITPKSNNDTLVVGGQKITIERAPWQVALVRKGKRPSDDGGLACGGSLISPKWVLTAAHCVYGKDDKVLPKDSLYVVFGTDELGLEVEPSEIALIVPNEKYKPANTKNRSHDIALIMLKGSAPADLAVSLATPENEAALYKPGYAVTVSGWGQTESGAISQRLMAVELDIVEINQCRQQHKVVISDDMICAGRPGKGSCGGDSGGPLVRADGFANVKQIGVVSFGPLYNCTKDNIPGVYTRVANYADWIKKIATDYIEKSAPINSANWGINMRKLMLRKSKLDYVFIEHKAGKLSSDEFERIKREIKAKSEKEN